ncbi:MAG: protein arginine kinase [bacterium]
MNSIGSQEIKGESGTAASACKTIDDLLWNFGSWLTHEDKYSDVIISSRIRLARNIEGYCFPNRASKESLIQILKNVKDACLACKSLKKAIYIEIDKLSEWERKFFVERRLASPQFIEKPRSSLLVVGHLESLSIMVNEEDHLRIQSIETGLRIKDAWKIISRVDDELGEKLPYSYSNQFGYLTACPTNTGTGMRVSIFVHLPALSMEDQINSVIQQLPTSEIAVRGFYGEGTDPVGGIFQISNQLTLGRTEEGMIERLVMIAKKLVDIERKTRDDLLKKDKTKLEDKIYRALGILEHARIVSSLEAMNLLSTVRLGGELGLLKKISRIAINQLLVLVQPAHLQRIYHKNLSPRERDITRAEFIRQNLQV